MRNSFPGSAWERTARRHRPEAPPPVFLQCDRGRTYVTSHVCLAGADISTPIAIALTRGSMTQGDFNLNSTPRCPPRGTSSLISDLSVVYFLGTNCLGKNLADLPSIPTVKVGSTSLSYLLK